MKTFNVKKYFPEVQAIFYTGPLDLEVTKVHCAKELINRMIVIGDKKECKLKKLLLSEEDMADIRWYADEQSSEKTGRHIDYFVDPKHPGYWGIGLQIDERLEGSGVIIGITEKDWAVIVGETGRYN